MLANIVLIQYYSKVIGLPHSSCWVGQGFDLNIVIFSSNNIHPMMAAVVVIG